MRPDFSGAHVLNRNASALGPAASAMVTANLRVTHDDPRFWCAARFASTDGAMEFAFERFADGRTTAVSEHEVSRCYWDGDTLVSEDRFGSGESAVIMTWRYELLDGGHRLRATERIRGGGRDQDNVWLFERS